MFDPILVVVLCIPAVIAVFTRNAKFHQATVAFLIAALLLREASLLVYAHLLVERCSLEGAMLESYKEGVFGVRHYYLLTVPYVITAAIALFALCRYHARRPRS